jgi:hypothetical protein
MYYIYTRSILSDVRKFKYKEDTNLLMLFPWRNLTTLQTPGMLLETIYSLDVDFISKPGFGPNKHMGDYLDRLVRQRPNQWPTSMTAWSEEWEKKSHRLTLTSLCSQWDVAVRSIVHGGWLLTHFLALIVQIKQLNVMANMTFWKVKITLFNKNVRFHPNVLKRFKPSETVLLGSA